ncbi:MAG: AAA family ATPase [Acidimicrobiia bacterium]|nr:AAA family ATPase [Acidimicrobiia bacterium]
MSPEAHARLIASAIPNPGPETTRYVVAIAGPPAAGKSTLAEAVVQQLGGRAGVLGMDAFHFDNQILEARGQLARKGSPQTFDVASYAMTLATLRQDRSLELSVPVFDRSLEVSRNCASLIRVDQDVIVTEGNYLLLRDGPWPSLRPLFDLTVWIDISMDTVEDRIVQRWESAGFEDVEVRRRVEENDLPNARVVHTGSVEADLVVRTNLESSS